VTLGPPAAVGAADCGGSERLSRHPTRAPSPHAGFGDAALDAAAAAAAAMPLGSVAEQVAAAGQLAVALARHRRFRRLCLLPAELFSLYDEVCLVDPLACSLALRLSRLNPQLDVDVCFDKQLS